MSADPTSSRLLETLARVVTPLVRLLIAKGVTYQAASEMLKRVYVSAAQKHFTDGEEATGTRLSLLTGLNRKEIKRLTEDGAHAEAPEGVTSFASAVRAVWAAKRRYRDKKGRPRILPRYSRDNSPSFDELVREVTTDHRPAAVLEELMRLELADLDKDGNVSLRAAPFVPRKSMEDRLEPLALNLEDHAAAAVQNVLAKEPPFLERSVFSDELSEESVAHLHELVRERWLALHDEVVAAAIAREELDTKGGKETGSRLRVGMYFYSESQKSQ
jgi:hypothetical protein